MGEDSDSYQFELTGGALCLDFANTLGDRPRCREEHLTEYADLLSWARQTDILPASVLDGLDRSARKHPRLAEGFFERAVELRETLYRIFGRLARSEEPNSEDIAHLNEALGTALPHLEVEEASDGFTWTWAGPGDALDRPLWPVLRSAADLLTSDEATALRECASETCSWLFVDRSRTRRRRWCDMSTCGNRAKARRHYRRQKQSRSAS